ncbi:hypothetical protein TCAL_01276 [Tigriopus californicus]|uniref:t-SNARE coiled-coil homology domain-containing protein n=1 Tax=Tigriopus californicus TaxID=6832 RepID=A0A553PDB4_TIGCA|nr:hypothetical protein TCAL_01276 [Tigriopus californicus]
MLQGRVYHRYLCSSDRRAVKENAKPLRMSFPHGEGCFKIFAYLISLPIMGPLYVTLPDPYHLSKRKFYLLTFIGSILWIALLTYLLIWWSVVVSQVLAIPDAVMGLLFLAAGTSIPDIVTSILVARHGRGDMVFSVSMSSNIFYITVRMSLPWLFFAIFRQETIPVLTSGMACSITLLALVLILRFELIQDDLETILEGILSSLTILSKKSQSSKAGSKEEVRHWIMRTRSSLVEARKLIEDMEQEARLAPIQFRGDMLTKVRQYREDTAKLQAQLRGFTEINTSGFGDSLNIRNPRDGPDWPEVTVEDRYRRQVLEGSNILERTSQSIQRSEQVAVETEAVGGEIISDLSVQREQLERTRGRIYDTYDELSRSQRILRRIYFGVIQNKVVLIVIIVIEILIIAGLVYLRFFS